MDMSFANQALSAEYVVQNAGKLEKRVYAVPEEIDQEIARLKLASMGVDIDTLTEEQAKYLASWDEGHLARSSPSRSSGWSTAAWSCSTSGSFPARKSSSSADRPAEVAEAIRVLAVRGAPAIGVAAAYGYALAAERGEDLDEAARGARSRPGRPR